MKSNIGSTDRIIRIALGIALAFLALFLHGHLRLLGVVGVVLLVTSMVNWCPIYALFGLGARR